MPMSSHPFPGASGLLREPLAIVDGHAMPSWSPGGGMVRDAGAAERHRMR
jgi:hypothetical protein